MEELKNGLIHENGELIYYKNGMPKHAGVIKVDGSIYYINSKGKAVKGQYIVHREMTNGILERGTYTFGEDYRLIKGSHIAPRKKKRKNIGTIIREKNRRRTGKSILSGFLNNKKNRLAVISVLVLIVLLFSLVIAENRTPQFDSSADEGSAPVSPRVKIVLPTFDEDVLLCSRAAKLEYDGVISLSDAIEAGNPYRPFYFEYHLENTDGILFLSENEQLLNASEYMLEESNQYIAIDNLKVDTTYYYKVLAGGQEFWGSFHTAPSTRFVSIPGLKNTRDIGGCVNLDGKKVKQGLLIRGVEFDGLINAPYFIPEDDLEYVQDTFSFVFDLDLRDPAIYNGTYSSRLAVEHKFYNATMYGGIFNQSSYPSLKEIFSDMADPEKYPMYLHCTWGRDRTGTVIFLLQGILNVSEENMKREYLLTSYVDKGLVNSNNMDVIIAGLAPYDGDTVQEKIVTFLTTEIGVTEEEIASIRSIFLEG